MFSFSLPSPGKRDLKRYCKGLVMMNGGEGVSLKIFLHFKRFFKLFIFSSIVGNFYKSVRDF